MERTISVSKSILDPMAIFALIIIGAITWVCFKCFTSGKRVIAFGIVWFFANLLPVSNIIPVNSFLAEHWIYTASIGLFMLVGIGLAWLWENIAYKNEHIRMGFVVGMGVIIGLYGGATVVRTLDWRTEIDFFESTLEYHPENTRLYLNLGNSYYEKEMVDDAIRFYLKAIELRENYVSAYVNLGSAYLVKGETEKAMKCLEKAIELKPDFPIAHYNLGRIYWMREQQADAEKSFLKVIEFLPQFYQSWNSLGHIYVEEGRAKDAKQAFSRSLKILPNQPDIREAMESLD